MMEEMEFQRRSEAAMQDLYKALLEAGDEHDFEADLNAGAITVEFFEPPARFVVSPNSPVRQIWVSALTKSFKLSWNEDKGEFALDDGPSLNELMSNVIGQQLGESVDL
jgi:CyaY protein